MTTALPCLDHAPDRDVLALVADLAQAHLAREARSDAATARRVLATHGVWTLGVAESAGGGGADDITTAYTLAVLGAAWPAVAHACAHAHAGTTAIALAADSGIDTAQVHEQGRPIAVLDAVHGRIASVPSGSRIRVTAPRIAVTGEADLVIAFADGAAVIPASEVRFSAPVRTTGLAGAHAVSVAAWVEPRHRGGSADTSAAIRSRLYRGVAAVAAGIAATASAYARRYATQRAQFGGPLTAIPSIRETLLEQEDAAVSALLHASAPATPLDGLLGAHHALDTAIESATRAVQILGGYGYLTEHPVEEYLRDAISLRACADVAWARADAARAWASSAPTAPFVPHGGH